MMHYLLLAISAILVSNIILTRFLGICPFVGVSKSPKNALGMSGALIGVVFMSSIISYAINRYLLEPLDLGFLKLIAFILVIASFVQFVEMFMKRYIPSLYKSLGIYLPLITTNCVVLTVALDVAGTSVTGSLLNWGEMLTYSAATAVGYALIIIGFSYIQLRMQNSTLLPKPFKGNAIALITAGLMAMAFMAFNGMIV
ncbi:MAG: Rnf-Nqr domain containing protein [Bacilli bacterium]|nr:Rnf-Nqr domain containing protein [Bacilli bacterium]MDD3389517.1 Rnf-Nqr domain containing protein [Bacilli bacterium]MDD4345138.1 Rnf-Nqr domain containing protein [Bacilli bacterium]MDD4521215.1 Rnf-Nqr domain containing protein [Bacilli bacterium]MDY0399946.1 Rnf-Nqr domain containing protein [Bacilli bacterium]